MAEDKRASDGRFVRGHKGGPGRPRRAVEEKFLRVLADVVSPDAWRQVCERALVDALEGDAPARQWLGKFLIGVPGRELPPAESIDDDGDQQLSDDLGEVEVEPTELVDTTWLERLPPHLRERYAAMKAARCDVRPAG